MTDVVVVKTTLDSREKAQEIGRMMVQERLAACVQIMPIESIYWWQDRLEQEKEWLLMFKTVRKLSPKLQKRVKDLHPYDIPELIEINVDGGSSEYLAWVSQETQTFADE